MMDTRLRYEYLVWGYTRNMEKMYKLFMNIDDGIYGIIHTYYPKLLRFDLWNDQKFTVSEDKLEIKGSAANECNGCGVYAESPNNKGFNAGIHYWSVKNMLEVEDWEEEEEHSMGDGYCFHSIGVRSEITESIISEDSNYWWPKVQCESQSYFKGECPLWGYQNIITVKLDCNEWTVTYYDEDMRFIKEDKITPDLSYYFYAHFCCNDSPYSHFKIVDIFEENGQTQHAKIPR